MTQKGREMMRLWEDLLGRHQAKRRQSQPTTNVPSVADVPGGGSALAVHEFSRDDIESILISADQLAARVQALAAQISADYAGKDLLLVGVLKGAAMFLMDLARYLTIPVEVDFVAASSYGNNTETSGTVEVLKDLDISLEGKHVLVVEDIVDTGLTLRRLLQLLGQRVPASLGICALLDKGKIDVSALGADAAYIGFTIPDQFVVGYGLDYAEKYRNLPYLGILKPSAYRAST